MHNNYDESKHCYQCGGFPRKEQNKIDPSVNVSALSSEVKVKLFSGIKKFDPELYRYVTDANLRKIRQVFGKPDLFLCRKKLKEIWLKVEE